MTEDRSKKRSREAEEAIHAADKSDGANPAAVIAAPSDGEDDDAPLVSNYKMSKAVRKGQECPYLDTISRQNLDFDFEKCCSVSLTHVNVYVCLVCGKYFQGRGPGTHAYTHALEVGHHLFMKLDTGRAYCLPDMYEVVDRSLEDIQYVLNPKFTEEDVQRAGTAVAWARALDGSEYMPGLVGLNNMKANDYANVVIQSMLRVTPLRDFFLRPENYAACTSPLVHRFGELVRKMHNPRAFKGHVSPHEFMQAAMTASGKRFLIDRQADPVEFFSWLANSLHADLTGGKRKRPSIITECLQGELEVITEAGTGKAKDSPTDIVERVPFLLLTLDLPPAPLFKDSLERVTIPQIPVFELLRKFDGAGYHEDVRAGRRRMRLTRLPRYLVLHVKRFVKNQFFLEKNPTIVNFPAKALDLAACVPVPATPQPVAGGGSKADSGAKYDLIANVVHEGTAAQGSYKVHVHRPADGVWYEVQDLLLAEVLPQQVVLSEAYLQVYQLREGGSVGGANANNK